MLYNRWKETRMPTVYVINKSSHDFSAAERYGPLVYLSEGLIDKWGINQIYREMEHGLASSKPDDYILLTGLPIQCILACAIFAMKHQRLNLLIHKFRKYHEYRLVLNGVSHATNTD